MQDESSNPASDASGQAIGCPGPSVRAPLVRAVFATVHRGSGRPLADSLATAASGAIELHEVVGSPAVLERLARNPCDVILVQHDATMLDAVCLIDALQAGGHDQPVLVLNSQPDPELEIACSEAGGQGYCVLGNTTPRLLVSRIREAIERSRVAREYTRLAESERRRLSVEHREAERLIDEQRRLVTQLESLEAPTWNRDSSESHSAGIQTIGAPPADIPAGREQHAERYHELLQTYVMMGAGNLAGELEQLADELIVAGISGRRAVEMHVKVLERLVEGLGTRSARHVMTRADLLVLELLVHLADGYGRRYDGRQESAHPPAPTAGALPGAAPPEQAA